MPGEIDELRRKIMQLEIEREALKIETDAESKKRLETIEHALYPIESHQKLALLRRMSCQVKPGSRRCQIAPSPLNM